MKIRALTTVATVVALSWASAASAQNWSFDARTIALGGVGSGSGNIAASLIDEQKPYRAIVIPLGLLQVLRDFDKFNPDSDDFDPIRAAEYAASPIHFVVGRDGTNTQNTFVTDVLNGELSRDLNDYAGFVPAGELVAEGLANPSFGKTFKFMESGGGFQGVFVGAGPYFSMQTMALVDEQLRTILDSDTPVYIGNAAFPIATTTAAQMALAVTGGYRAKLPLPTSMASGGELDGLYIAANYNYLHGFRYEAFDSTLNLQTDGAGLLSSASGLGVTRESSTSGRGFAIDVGAGVVVDRWQFGFGANGLANRIDWNDLEGTIYSLDALFDGDGDFEDVDFPGPEEFRVELPVDYRAYAAYNTDAWGATAEWANGFQGTTFRGGLEKKWESIELRGGGRFVRDRWEPSGGVGFNFNERVGLDVAAFGTSANAERERHLAIALSFRIMQMN